MTKKWSLMVLCGTVMMTGFGRSGHVQAAPAAAGERIVVTSANDPTRPVPGGVRWFWRMHASYVEQTKNKKFDLCFLGDSITQMWPRDLFGKYYGKYNAVNFGIGGDRTENVLWRLQNGELKGTSPKVIVLLIGTNNSGMNTAPEVALGVMTVVKTLRTMLPRTKILLLGVFPKRDMTLEKTKAVNAFLVKLDDRRMIRYLDAGTRLLDKDGKILDGVLRDAVHLTRKGFEIWAEAMNPLLAEMMTKRAVPDNAKRSDWNGYEMRKFTVGGRSALLVVPKKAAPGKPWIWRTEFFGVAPQADIALLGKGLHVAYVGIGGLFGAPVALDAMDEYYAHVRETYGLSAKPVLEGFSRGGLYAFNWAARHPDQVACIYVDAPVCDFKSWPGGQGRARHSGRDWRQLLSAYRMNDKQALAYKLNPVDNLAPLAEAKIPILSVIGDMHDWIVPIDENTLVVEKRYKALGGDIQVIRKPKAGHRPHSLPDPAPIVEFVLKYVPRSGKRTTARLSSPRSTGLPREATKASPETGAARAAGKGRVAAETEAQGKAEAIAQGLVVHWEFDDLPRGGVRDSSGKRNHGAVMGARWTARGKLGGALDFDGVDDYMSVPRTLAVDFSGAFTVCLWVKLDSVSRFDPLIGVTQDGNNYAFCLCIEGGLRLYTKAGGGLDATSVHSTRVGPGVWYHFAAAMDAHNNCTMYVNGAGETSRNVTQRNNRGILHIARMANAGAWTEKIDGLIDDVRVYSRALSAEEVKFVHGRAPVPRAPLKPEASPPRAGAKVAETPAESGAGAPQGNLIKNGGFEEKDARRFAAGWTKAQWGARGAGSSVRLDRSNPHVGEHALVLRGLAEGGMPGISTTLRLDPGTYEIRYWVCADIGKRANVGARFAGKDLTEHRAVDQWKQFTDTVAVEKRTLNARLGFWVSTPQVRVWFDEVELVRK